MPSYGFICGIALALDARFVWKLTQPVATPSLFAKNMLPIFADWQGVDSGGACTPFGMAKDRYGSAVSVI